MDRSIVLLVVILAWLLKNIYTSQSHLKTIKLKYRKNE